MVIQEQAAAPMELQVNNLRTKRIKYDLIENHVRELLNYDDFSAPDQPVQDPSPTSEKIRKKKAKKRTRTAEENVDITSPKLDHVQQNDVTEVSPSDLEELRTVYKKCKDVLNRIETKYGHLLELQKPGTSKQNKTKRTEDSSASETECTCGGNKKIIFDEEGREIITQTNLDNHICPKRSKLLMKSHVSEQNVNIEYEDASLPNDIKALALILKSPDIDATYRNKVNYHMKMLKQELLNEVRFNRPALMEKLKSKSEDVLEFKGSNLLSLPGYPDTKTKQ